MRRGETATTERGGLLIYPNHRRPHRPPSPLRGPAPPPKVRELIIQVIVEDDTPPVDCMGGGNGATTERSVSPVLSQPSPISAESNANFSTNARKKSSNGGQESIAFYQLVFGSLNESDPACS